MWKDRAVSPNPGQDKSHFRLFKHRPGFDGLCHKHLICWSWSLPTFWHLTNAKLFGSARMEIWGDTHTENDTQTHGHRERQTNTWTHVPIGERKPDCYTAIFLPIVIVIVVTTLCICLSFKPWPRRSKLLKTSHAGLFCSFGLTWHQGSGWNGCSGLRGEIPAKSISLQEIPFFEITQNWSTGISVQP